MKPSYFTNPLRRLSAARITFTLASCVAAAAVAIAAPQRTSPSTSIVRNTEPAPNAPAPTGPDALPASMNEYVNVMLEMNGDPAAATYAEAFAIAQAEATALDASRAIPMAAAQNDTLPRVEIDAAATNRVKSVVTALDAAQQALLPAISNAGADVLFRTQRAYNGIAVRVTPDRIPDLARLPGVKAVRPMDPKYPTAFSDINFTGTQAFWNKSHPGGVGIHGNGVKIAIIDSGVDYIHANFGGPGTHPAEQGINDEGPVPNPWFPSQKFPFGFDFAGDDYAFPGTPQPDPNPLDSAENGHGTSCASLAAGFGVNAGGTTYVGNYSNATPFASMKIAPGYAPHAQIVPIRIFGKSGSTILTTPAIEFAMDPNGDGDFSDRVDIISMSLGSNNGTADDDSAVASSNAAAAGIIVVTSAGNAQDTYYITGSPGTATGALSTAASFNDQAGYIYNASLLVNRPTNMAGSRAFAIYGNPSPRAPEEGLNGDVVEARPRIGSDVPSGGTYDPTPLDNAAFMAGKICLVDRGTSGFWQKAMKCQNSGAIAVVIANNAPGDPIVPGLTPNAGGPSVTIPVVMISQSDANAFRGSALFDANGVAQGPGGANVTIFNDNGAITRSGGPADTMPGYSSRGPRIGDTALKPDITAPAEVVGVATSFTGSGVSLFNGTSSACPHVSGSMALMKQLHPTWSQVELRANAMNTATHDLFTTTARTTRHGVSRVGAGRMDNAKAANNNVIAFNRTNPQLVSISFGSVEVPVDGSVSLTKQVTVRDKRTSGGALTYRGSVEMLNTVGDANFSAPQSEVTLSPGQDVTFPLLFRATGSTLKHTRDASVSNAQAVTGGTLGREWLSEAAGYGVLTPITGPGGTVDTSRETIRIPLYAAPKPVGNMRASQSAQDPEHDFGTFGVTLTGTPVFTGTTFPNNAGTGTDIIGLVKPLELHYASPDAGNPDAPNDPNVIKYVGVTSDWANRPSNNKQTTVVTFAIEGFGEATVPSFVSSDKEIFLDMNADGIDDYVIYFDSRRQSSNTALHSNVYYPVFARLNPNGSTVPGSAFYSGFATNLFPSNLRDVNAFNNSAILASVPSSQFGYTGAGQSHFHYRVAAYNRSGALVDLTPYMRFDLARPGYDATGPSGTTEPFYYNDLPGVTFDVAYNGNWIRANNALGLLLVHRHNGQGNRTEVVRLRRAQILDFSPEQGPVGTDVTITGRSFNEGTRVLFSPGVNAQRRVLSENTIVATVPPGAVTGPITVTSPGGSDTSEKVFTVTAPPEPSPSPSATPVQSPNPYIQPQPYVQPDAVVQPNAVMPMRGRAAADRGRNEN